MESSVEGGCAPERRAEGGTPTTARTRDSPARVVTVSSSLLPAHRISRANKRGELQHWQFSRAGNLTSDDEDHTFSFTSIG